MADGQEVVEIEPTEGELGALPDAAPIEAEENPSIDDALDQAFAAAKEKQAPKEADKGKKEDAEAEPPEPAPKKPVKAKIKEPEPEPEESDDTDDEDDADADAAAAVEGKHVNAPARLLPKAREVWANTPRVVQAEFERMEREHSAEIEQHREAKAFADELAQYRDMATQAGTSVKQALDRYVEFDRRISQDFGAGVAEIAKTYGLSPKDAVAKVLAGYGVTPHQYAQAVAKNPQAFAAAPAPARQQQPATDPVAQRALQEVEALKKQMQQQSLEASVIAPFAATRPRFAELQEPIAKLLKSGMVPTSLSAAERLEVAYDMAERLNPSPVVASKTKASPDRPADPDNSGAGKKSISGAPSMTSKTAKAKRPVPSIDEALNQAFRGAS